MQSFMGWSSIAIGVLGLSLILWGYLALLNKVFNLQNSTSRQTVPAIAAYFFCSFVILIFLSTAAPGMIGLAYFLPGVIVAYLAIRLEIHWKPILITFGIFEVAYGILSALTGWNGIINYIAESVSYSLMSFLAAGVLMGGLKQFGRSRANPPNNETNVKGWTEKER